MSDFWYTSKILKNFFMGSGGGISTLFVTPVNPLSACLSVFRISAYSLSFSRQPSGSLLLLYFKLSAFLPACICAVFLPVLFFASCFLLLSYIFLYRIHLFLLLFRFSLSFCSLFLYSIYIYI